MDFMKAYKIWCEDSYFDEATKTELRGIKENPQEIEDRFGRSLEFGTGGLRGVIGAGTNRMNIYTVRQATQGLANYIISRNGQKRGVAIAFDSRNMSPEFAKEAALCFNANGILTYLFDSLRPTPELSFSVRHLNCIAGIVITASHNPREYNGYKVYWEDGAQITSPHDKNILFEVSKVTSFSQIKLMSQEQAKEQELHKIIGKEIDDSYMEELKKQSIHPEIINKAAKEIKIVYTPLHGAGNLPVRRVLSELGFEKVYVVKEQEHPDGAFPTIAYPNPEDEKAWVLALKLAKEVDADIVLATDPDADRLGVYVKADKTGEYIGFTGNMSGSLMAEYILEERGRTGTMPSNPAVVETIVTTDMVKAIAAEHKAALLEVLTGFKYIGEQIRLFEERQTYHYVFGLEESYGCLAGTYARDKDACVAVMLLCEVAAYYKMQGKTLWDAMLELYEKYGFYKEGLATITYKGIQGLKQIQKIMEELRIEPPKKLGGLAILAIRDYKEGLRRNTQNGKMTPTELPKSNVLYYELEENSWCCVRPSGTEPKIKFYFGVKGASLEDANKKLGILNKDVLSARFLEKSKCSDEKSKCSDEKSECSDDKESRILFIEPIFKQMLWGGKRLGSDFLYNIPGDHTGECWGISANEKAEVKIREGKFKGKTLSKLWKQEQYLFGERKEESFPLLIKIIDAREDLSLQVHPDDRYAMEQEQGSLGKSECWYIIDCPEQAELVIGHNAKTKEALIQMIENKQWDKFIRRIPVKKGDFIQIAPGTVHAITSGCLVLETQQNSDITYRIYDYDRLCDGKLRELQQQKSIDVIQVPAKAMEDSIQNFNEIEENKWIDLIYCEYYKVMKLNLKGTMSFEQNYDFLTMSVIDGEGTLNGKVLRKGDHLILPVQFGSVEMIGKMQIIASTVIEAIGFPGLRI